MPPANQKLKEGVLLRELLYGPAKTKKTWWAARAAEAGFNVHLFDGDDGAHIINNIKPEVRERINVIDIRDTLNSQVMAIMMTHFLRASGPVVYDETARKRVILEKSMKLDHGHYIIDVNKLNKNDVFILDSWTAFAKSLKFKWYQENGVDVSIL